MILVITDIATSNKLKKNNFQKYLTNYFDLPTYLLIIEIRIYILLTNLKKDLTNGVRFSSNQKQA